MEAKEYIKLMWEHSICGKKYVMFDGNKYIPQSFVIEYEEGRRLDKVVLKDFKANSIITVGVSRIEAIKDE